MHLTRFGLQYTLLSSVLGHTPRRHRWPLFCQYTPIDTNTLKDRPGAPSWRPGQVMAEGSFQDLCFQDQMLEVRSERW